ncbi:MAG: flavodoxin family protein [Chloroflexota bacterium]
MKVLGIMGSPRIKGNTDRLLDQALKGAADAGAAVEKITVDKLGIGPCKEYYGCLKDGNCVIRDDMDAIYPKLLEADAVIVAAPMFFYAVPAQLKALIDRSQATWARRYVLKNLPEEGHRGAFIGVGATRGEHLFDGAIMTIKYFFKAINVHYAAELLIRGVDQRGEIEDHPDDLRAAYEMGKNLGAG